MTKRLLCAIMIIDVFLDFVHVKSSTKRYGEPPPPYLFISENHYQHAKEKKMRGCDPAPFSFIILQLSQNVKTRCSDSSGLFFGLTILQQKCCLPLKQVFKRGRKLTNCTKSRRGFGVAAPPPGPGPTSMQDALKACPKRRTDAALKGKHKAPSQGSGGRAPVCPSMLLCSLCRSQLSNWLLYSCA